MGNSSICIFELFVIDPREVLEFAVQILLVTFKATAIAPILAPNNLKDYFSDIYAIYGVLHCLRYHILG